jgi:N-acetylglucosaminyl-diphospho-decaprenol L-rhamnosyltransferase
VKLLVVVINYRTPDLTLHAVATTLRELDAIPESAIALVENDSRDGSYERFNEEIAARGWGKRVHLSKSAYNGGFSYGVNQGVRPSLESGDPAEYFYLLNSDAAPEPGAITKLLEFLEDNPRAGIAGSRIIGTDGTPHETAFRFHNLRAEFASTAVGIPGLSRFFDPVIVAMPMPTERTRVDWLAGASMLIRRDVFRTAGLFDERYFLYYEETDFCLRVKEAGWETWYIPESRVEHVGAASTGWKDFSKPRTPHWFKGRRYFWLKNHGRPILWLANALWLAGLVFGRSKAWLARKPYASPPRFMRDFLKHNLSFARIGRPFP